MTDKILCPYCGAEMVFLDFFTACKVGGGFKCEKCSSYSPYGQLAYTVEEAKKNAIYVALRRYQPENRVLTACEIDALDDSTPVWHEARYHSPATKWLCADFIKDVLTHSTNVYGKTWRCWLRKPTEEERKAVKWE